ncbi:hypothetical protein SACC_07360 [Saccharolobus caldissimus]|uniref:Uncharacterized protein n=1 Tax=Saccharolobus caldissimus TaxID=1702097 RepID=A0AAQ4CPI8_9CREN|nr:hypothetical protein SACC_07360 [Saccharolobus caldissimus]
MISTQIPKSYVKRTSVFYTLGEGIVISADIQSESNWSVLSECTSPTLSPDSVSNKKNALAPK